LLKKILQINYNFNPFWVQHASIHVKSTGTQVKKGNCKGILNKFIRSRGRSPKKYLRLRGVGAERNIFGSATLENIKALSCEQLDLKV
jgi:hypothetical protein